ncbi:MAG TPA: hypothetical protein VHC22_28470 [Pirellulales bacterium]|nr:hypothetical protein [Pirellulales bacterium]
MFPLCVRLVRPLGLLVALLVCVSAASAQTKKDKAKGGQAVGPADYRSEHFLVHSDLSAEEAKDLLDRLETMLSLISQYWARPCAGIIECYVVNDLSNWPDGQIPPEGLGSVQAGAGVTVTSTLSGGVGFLARSVVYAKADHGTPQHEAVHAYCGQTFGTTGPTWYSEGMAEMGQYWRKDDKSVRVHDVVIDYLRSSPPKSLNEIVNGEEFTGDSWQNYAWRWALCHLLANNTNYSAKFRPLGLALLKKEPTSFEAVYGDMAEEIVFEYRFFLEHLEQGFRADLCSWEWKRKSRLPKGSAVVTAKIKADHGWQHSGAMVTSGTSYDCSAPGTWQTSKEGPAVSADGAEQNGAGRLLGIIMSERDGKDFKLGEPFELGSKGRFTATTDGKLYLRCQDSWGELADNKGTLTVKIKAGKPD